MNAGVSVRGVTDIGTGVACHDFPGAGQLSLKVGRTLVGVCMKAKWVLHNG